MIKLVEPAIDEDLPAGGERREAHEAIEGFDAEEAMNDREFVEFLAQFDDAETFDVDDLEQLKVRFDAFSNVHETSAKLPVFLRTEIQSQGIGMDFDSVLEEQIGARMEQIAHEDPEKLNEIADAMEEFEGLYEEIKRSEERVAGFYKKGDLEDAIEELYKKKETLMKAAETEEFLTGAGFASRAVALYERFAFGFSVEHAKEWLANNEGSPTVTTREEMEAFVAERSAARERHEARIAVQRDYSIEPDRKAIEKALSDTEFQIEQRFKQLKTLERLESEDSSNKARFEALRELLLAGIGANDHIRDSAKRLAAQKLSDLMDSDPEQAQTFFDNLRTVSADNSFDIDYIEGRDKELQAEIDARIEDRLMQDMREVIETSHFGGRPYDKLARSLERFLAKERLGSKEGQDAKDFVLDTLREIAADISPKDKARGILLRFLLARLSGKSAANRTSI